MKNFVKFTLPFAAVLALSASAIEAQDRSQSPSPSAREDCPGYGPGAGMGPGMMGGHRMGPGAGNGMDPGMMGGYGHGMGGMFGWNVRGLGLTPPQEAQVNKISDELRKKNWEVMGKMQDEAAKLRDLYSSDKLDRGAISSAYKRLGELRQSRIENSLEAQEKIESLLTPEQRKEFRRRAYESHGR
jgi:Spy/CpxP family protein refolding chaperone